MKKLKVDLDEIAFVMEKQDDFESAVLFDTETGEVINIPDEVMSAAESGDEEEIADLPEWEQELMETARAVLSDEEGRFQDIPRRSSSEGYDLMVEFMGSMRNAKLRDRLTSALHGKGVFRRFKDVLRDYPDEENRWHVFHNEKMREDARGWLNSLGIEPVEGVKEC
jgi:hypothetical protein